MSKKSIKRNYIYNLTYQLLLIITPLITTPYISRVLGADGIGTYSYHESIVSYFVLFANIGMTIYGQREISYCQDNKEKRSAIFWDIKCLSLLTCSISILLYSMLGFMNGQGSLFFVFMIYIISAFFDISWLFQGMEEFGKIIFRNIIFKFINIIFIFSFIKKPNDLLLYIFSMCIFTFLSNISLWLYLPKYINSINLKELNPFKNIKVILLLFLPTIAVQIYTVLDKTMIGIITQDAFQNGYYEQAMKISKIVLALVTSLGTVMIPRIGFHYSKGEYDIVRSYMYRGYKFVWFLGIPICFGLIGISSNFVPWFFGEGFDGVVPLLIILSFLVLSIGINNVTGMQYLIPTGRENIFTITVVIGAITNFVINLILIPRFQALGAAIASVVAETTIAIVQIYIVRKELKPLIILKSMTKYIIAGILMLILLVIEDMYLSPSIINTFFLVCSGSVLYFGILFGLKDEFLISNMNNIINKFKRN